MIKRTPIIFAAIATLAGNSPAIAKHHHGHGRPFIQFHGGHYWSRGGGSYGYKGYYGGYSNYGNNGYGYRQPNNYYRNYEQPGEIVQDSYTGQLHCHPTPYRVEPGSACTIGADGRARLGY